MPQPLHDDDFCEVADGAEGLSGTGDGVEAAPRYVLQELAPAAPKRQHRAAADWACCAPDVREGQPLKLPIEQKRPPLELKAPAGGGESRAAAGYASARPRSLAEEVSRCLEQRNEQLERRLGLWLARLENRLEHVSAALECTTAQGAGTSSTSPKGQDIAQTGSRATRRLPACFGQESETLASANWLGSASASVQPNRRSPPGTSSARTDSMATAACRAPVVVADPADAHTTASISDHAASEVCAAGLVKPRSSEGLPQSVGTCSIETERSRFSIGPPRGKGAAAHTSKGLQRRPTMEQKMQRYTQQFSIMREALFVQEDNWAVRVVSHVFFDCFIILVWFASTVLIGAQVQWQATRGNENLVYTVLEFVCGSIFAAELVLRFRAFKWGMLSRQMRWWTAFDVFLVFLSGLDFILTMTESVSGGASTIANASAAKLLKLLRMTRVLRVMRMLRFFGELRVMVHMIVSSLKSLFWLFCMLIIILYVTSILFTGGATEFRAETTDPVMKELVELCYGSLFITMYTLFKAMTGGVNWGEVAEPLRPIGIFFFLLFLIYIFCMLFSVLNIVTGVFVDSAIQVAQRDRTVLIEKTKRDREAMVENLMHLLEDLDQNKSGTITQEELRGCMHRVKDELEALGIQVHDMETLCEALDVNGDGEVDILEFVDGLQALHGDAKRCDIRIMMLHQRNLMEQVHGFFRVVGKYDEVLDQVKAQKVNRLSMGFG